MEGDNGHILQCFAGFRALLIVISWSNFSCAACRSLLFIMHTFLLFLDAMCMSALIKPERHLPLLRVLNNLVKIILNLKVGSRKDPCTHHGVIGKFRYGRI